MTKIGILLLVVLCSPTLAQAQIVCDVRHEILTMVLAADRFSATTSAAALQQLPKADAVRASIDFQNVRSRAYYVCPTQLRREGSPEKEIIELVSRRANANEIMLIQGVAAMDNPTAKAGHEAGLKLIDVAARYFGLTK